jgi:hypothetical protein
MLAMRQFLIGAAIFALAAFAAGTSHAGGEWSLIGAREVMDRVDTDVITINDHRRFDRIKICVFRSSVHFIDLDVHFENGGHQDVALASRIGPRDCTRVIDLEGGQRDIARIVFKYEEDSRRARRAEVRVFAK